MPVPTRLIRQQVLPWHPLLGRNVNLDSKSWAYAIQPSGDGPIVSIRHEAFIGILNQGDTGSCTGNASLYCAYRAPFFAPTAMNWQFAPNEDGAREWYHRNTAEDDFAGTWNTDGSGQDTGSDGLTSSKVAVEVGIASGYQTSGDLPGSLEVLADRPGITGLPWYNSMFEVGSNGLISIDRSSGLAGGHELCVDEIVAADDPRNSTGKHLVGGPNSWGEDWGDGGRWYMTAQDWMALRQEQGDVYFWTAKSQPAPEPTPDVDSRDADMWAGTAAFRHGHHVAPGHVEAAKALRTWGEAGGLPW